MLKYQWITPFHQEHLNRHFPVDDTGIDPDKNRIQKRHRSH